MFWLVVSSSLYSLSLYNEAFTVTFYISFSISHLFIHSSSSGLCTLHLQSFLLCSFSGAVMSRRVDLCIERKSINVVDVRGEKLRIYEVSKKKGSSFVELFHDQVKWLAKWLEAAAKDHSIEGHLGIKQSGGNTLSLSVNAKGSGVFMSLDLSLESGRKRNFSVIISAGHQDLEEMKSSRGEGGRRRHHKDSEKRSTGSDMIAEVSQNYKKDVSYLAKGKEHWNITRSNLDNEGEKTHVHHKKQKLLADVVRAEGVGGTGAINAAITIQQIEPGEDQIYLLKPQQKQQSKNLPMKSKVGFNATRIIGQCALNSAIHSFNLEAAGPTLDDDNDNSKLDASHHSYLKMLTSPAGNHFSKVIAGGGVKDKGKTKEDHGAEADSSVNSSLRFDQPVLSMFYPHRVKSVSSGISIGMESQEKELMSKLEGQGKDDFIVQSDRANGSDVSDPQKTSEAIGEKVMGDLGLSALK